MRSDLILLPSGALKGILIISCHVLTLLLMIWDNYIRLHATLSQIFHLCMSCCQLRGRTQSALCVKMTEEECRFKSTSCPVFVIQTLISMCLISRLPLHRGPVTARLPIQRPKLKLPKASALKHWINHPHFLHTTANHLRVRLTLPPLIIKMERSEVFFSCLAVLLALINGAPLMENYTANVTLSTLGHGSFIAEGERVSSQFFFSFLSQACINGITRNNQTRVQMACAYIFVLPGCCANIASFLSRFFNLSEVPVEWPDASRE